MVGLSWMQTLCGASGEGEQVVGHTRDGIPIVLRPQTVDAQSSEAYRQNQRHQVSMGVGLLVSSLTYGYLIRPEWVFELYGQRQLEFIEGDSRAGTIGMKWIPGESFYLKSAFAFRESRTPQFDNTINQQMTKRHQDQGLDLSVGNQWSWRRWFLNTEWAGFYIPMLHRSSDDGTLVQFRLVQVSVGMVW